MNAAQLGSELHKSSPDTSVCILPASAAQPSNRQYKLLMHVINKVFYKVIVNNLFGKRVQGFHKFYQISNPNIL